MWQDTIGQSLTMNGQYESNLTAQISQPSEELDLAETLLPKSFTLVDFDNIPACEVSTARK